MAEQSPQPPEWLRPEARRVYGTDPEGYDAARPDYPERVYHLLQTRCRIGPGSEVVEIGPGTGRVTRRLVALGASVVALEPDPAFARYLAESTAGQSVEVVISSFEDVPLPDDRFDAAVGAMSFHWVDQDVGLPKLGRIVRRGGWVALWWTFFADPDRPDPFHDATKHLLDDDGLALRPGQRPFELDAAERMSDLAHRAGLVDVEHELIRWSVQLDPDALRALSATMIRIRRRPPEERERLLDALASVATERFGGAVERPFVTAIYTGCRP